MELAECLVLLGPPISEYHTPTASKDRLATLGALNRILVDPASRQRTLIKHEVIIEADAGVAYRKDDDLDRLEGDP